MRLLRQHLVYRSSKAAFVGDLDKLLWVKNKTIFVPPAAPGLGWDKMDFIVREYCVPVLVDNIFKTTPIFRYLEGKMDDARSRNWKEFKTAIECDGLEVC